MTTGLDTAARREVWKQLKVQKVASILPLTQGIKLMKAVSMGTQTDAVWKIVALLVGITLICGMVSVKTFRWE